jgi:hypothetical protein
MWPSSLAKLLASQLVLGGKALCDPRRQDPNGVTCEPEFAAVPPDPHHHAFLKREVHTEQDKDHT